MIDLILARETEAFAAMAKRMGITPWYIPSREAALFPAKAKFSIIDGQHPALRSQIEQGISAVINLETDPKPDGLHSRRSGLNQVLAALLHRKKGMMLFNHRLVRENVGQQRALIIGRMQQNVALCRKYKVPMAIVTMAKTPYELRSPHDLQSFGTLLKMTPAECKAAVRVLGSRTSG